jgi:hypothetical protein
MIISADSRSTHRVFVPSIVLFPSGYINIHDVHLYPPQVLVPSLVFLHILTANRLGALTMLGANPSPSALFYSNTYLNFFAAILYSLCPVLLLTLILTFILL